MIRILVIIQTAYSYSDWLTQEQLLKLFYRDRSDITKHIGNIFSECELGEQRNVQNLHIPDFEIKKIVVFLYFKTNSIML